MKVENIITPRKLSLKFIIRKLCSQHTKLNHGHHYV